MKILNSKGEPIVLNAQEQRVADYNQNIVNALGLEVPITTLTTIVKKVTEQKFFQIAPADYLPVRVGEGAWSSNLVTYRSFSIGDDFETGVVNQGANSTRLAAADTGVDAVTVAIKNWAKSIGWSLFELQQAAKAGNWDLVSAKEKSRKKNWDLGVQKVAFLGITGSSITGLLNMSGITTDTTTITKSISAMTADELNTFCINVIEKYRSNCNRTAFPTHFIIPESCFNGLGSQMSATYPVKTKLAMLEEVFQLLTMNKGFKILPLAYADSAYNSIGKQCYVLLNYDEESLRMDIPVDYTSTLANSIDNFSFQNVAYGQFTGCNAYRPLEILYFQHS